jgi:hypothetical protein
MKRSWNDLHPIPRFEPTPCYVGVKLSKSQLFYLVEVCKVDTPRKREEWECPPGFPALAFKLLYHLGRFFGPEPPEEVEIQLSQVEILSLLHNVSYTDKWSDGSPVGATVIQKLAVAARELHFKEQVGLGFGSQEEPETDEATIKRALEHANQDPTRDRDPDESGDQPLA